jgi:hypothetical protein
MRVMVKFRFPVESGNEAIRSGKVAKVFERVMEELKPEAAYFFPDGGERAGLLVFDMRESSQVAETAERFFFGLNASVEMTPVMAAEDLRKGLSGVEDIAKNYA